MAMLSASPDPSIPLDVPGFGKLSPREVFQEAVTVQHASARAHASADSGSGSDEDGTEPWQDAETVRKAVSMYKKRAGPAGPGVYDFGPNHVHGQHPVLDAAVVVPNLAARSGMGAKLRPPKLEACSCVPPLKAEPYLSQPSTIVNDMAQHAAMRTQQRHLLMNRIVYDCLQPPRPPQQDDTAGPDGADRDSTGRSGSADMQGRQYASQSSTDDRSSYERDSRRHGAAISRPTSAVLLPALTPSNRSSASDIAALNGNGCRRQSRDDSLNAGQAPMTPCQDPQGHLSSEGSIVQDRASSGSACSTSYARQFDYFPDLPAWQAPSDPADTTLVFESRFESGNLRRAIQVHQFEYDLILRPDINTNRHTQWFYFAVMNMKQGHRYKFNIINLTKPDSLYNEGMQPLLHSAVLMASQQIGWHRSGEQIAYYKNKWSRKYFSLTFTLHCQHDHDLVHLAHCYPYTYTDMQTYIKAIELDPARRPLVERCLLCSSLAGNAVDCLTITAPDKPDVVKRRKGVVISARVHPGESNASWMMKGVLDLLTGHTPAARRLRSMFVFKLVPMVNPDGVIVGNYRCSLAGQDLNRVWNDPSKKLHPTIHALKGMLKAFMDEREVVLFCDLHGHSRKHDIFVYGCQKKDKDNVAMYPGYPVPGSVGAHPRVPTRLQDKLLPLLLYHSAPDLFSYRSCAFKVQKSKAGTGRVVGFRELGLVNSFTMEASFAGASSGRWAGEHFSAFHLENMGAALLSALMDAWDSQQYGFRDLLAELEFLHPPGMDKGRQCIRGADGQWIEVDGDRDEDGPATDSDDESSDEDRRRSARAARAQLRAQAAAAAAASLGNPGTVPMSNRARKAKLAREQLQEQRQRANEGVMACLPLINANYSERSESVDGSDVGAQSQDRLHALKHSGYSKVPTAASLEYARARGIYKGEAISWANAGEHLANGPATKEESSPRTADEDASVLQYGIPCDSTTTRPETVRVQLRSQPDASAPGTCLSEPTSQPATYGDMTLQIATFHGAPAASSGYAAVAQLYANMKSSALPGKPPLVSSKPMTVVLGSGSALAAGDAVGDVGKSHLGRHVEAHDGHKERPKSEASPWLTTHTRQRFLSSNIAAGGVLPAPPMPAGFKAHDTVGQQGSGEVKADTYVRALAHSKSRSAHWTVPLDLGGEAIDRQVAVNGMRAQSRSGTPVIGELFAIAADGSWTRPANSSGTGGNGLTPLPLTAAAMHKQDMSQQIAQLLEQDPLLRRL